MPNELNEVGQITVDYVELTNDFAPTTGNFAYDDSSQERLLEVDWDDANQAIEDILGTQWREGDTLMRTPPVQHPEFPHLYATRCRPQNVKMSDEVGPYENKYGKSATYEKTRITVTYQSLPYKCVWQNKLEMGDEWARFTSRVPHPTSEAYTIPSQMVGYAEGTPVPSPAGLPVPTQKVIGKTDIVLTWWNIPSDYLCDPETGIVGNILGYQNPDPDKNQTPDGGVGRVNFTDFMGYPAGTLLCMPPLITPRMAPVPYLDSYTTEDSVRLFNVQFTFKYFDGPIGPGCTTRGWNTAINLNDFLYYGVRSKDSSGHFTGPPPYNTYEFRNFWKAESSLLDRNS